MRAEDQKAILAIALHAAFADGAKDDREREEVRRIAESLASASPAIDLRALYQDVLLKRFGLGQLVSALSDEGLRHYAYEMALGVCEADGRTTAAERRFLDELKASLGLGNEKAGAIERELDPFVAATSTVTASDAGSDNAQLDQSILNYALLNGALELLPQSWASMVIIPLEIKMVYGIGQAHGVALDQGHVKEFIAASGVGLTSQYLEQFGRKLLGGLLGKVAGGMGKGIGKTATSVAFSFATTYALGQVAKRYYAGGRQMNTAVLQDSFKNMLGPAKEMQAQYLPQIRDKAQNLDMGQVMSLVRGA